MTCRSRRTRISPPGTALSRKEKTAKMIHKQLLTHDNVLGNASGKVIDLGFNGDFDIKNHRWNMVFIALPAGTYDATVALTVKTLKPDVYNGGPLAKDSLVMKDGCVYKCIASANSKATWDDAEWKKLDLDGVKTETFVDIGKVEVTSGIAGNGGVFGIVMPKGLGRYFTMAVSGANDKVVTAGITDMVDNDVNPGIDWTYYKADTHGVCQPGRIEKAMAALV